MVSPELTPKEKKRISRYIHNVEMLSYKPNKNEVETFIMRRQLTALLELLGVRHRDLLFEARALKIIRDMWPWKERRLRKLVNGRRSR